MTIEQLSAFSATDKRGTAAIESITSGQWQRAGSAYIIRGHRCSAAWCDCLAFRYASDGVCRHLLSAALLDELSNEQAAF